MRFLLILVATCTLCVTAQESDPKFTGQMSNGRLWQELDKDEKLSYVAGAHDILISITLTKLTKPTRENSNWAEGFTLIDYIKVIDEVYKDVENVRIPVPWVIGFSTQKLKGMLTKAELEDTLMSIRGLTSDLR
jgi:hypothetical protein